MQSGCCRLVAVVSQAYPGNAKMFPGFPSYIHLRQPLSLLQPGYGALGSMVQQ